MGRLGRDRVCTDSKELLHSMTAASTASTASAALAHRREHLAAPHANEEHLEGADLPAMMDSFYIMRFIPPFNVGFLFVLQKQHNSGVSGLTVKSKVVVEFLGAQMRISLYLFGLRRPRRPPVIGAGGSVSFGQITAASLPYLALSSTQIHHPVMHAGLVSGLERENHSHFLVCIRLCLHVCSLSLYTHSCNASCPPCKRPPHCLSIPLLLQS